MRLIIAIFFIVSFLACSSSEKPSQNEQNIKKIMIGMKLKEMKEIMGDPEEVLVYPKRDNEYSFRYLAPSGLSGDYEVFVSRKDSTVVSIYYGD
jgi:hypothetical protein